MENGKSVYEVQVAGVTLKLRSSHDQETVDELSQLVDQKVRETLGAAPSISFQNALILTALNLAEDQLLLKKAAQSELASIESQTQRILDQLEENNSTSPSLDC